MTACEVGGLLQAVFLPAKELMKRNDQLENIFRYMVSLLCVSLPSTRIPCTQSRLFPAARR